MLVYLVVAHVLQLISPLWATHIGDGAESGALQEYMRHRTVQAAQHTYETRLGLHTLFIRIVAASVGECLLSQPDLTPGWLHGSSPKFMIQRLELSSKEYMLWPRALSCYHFAARFGDDLLHVLL